MCKIRDGYDLSSQTRVKSIDNNKNLLEKYF